MKGLWFVLAIFLVTGCVTSGAANGPNSTASPQSETVPPEWILQSTVVKAFLKQNPDATIGLQQIASADFSLSDKKQFLDNCEDRTWVDGEYLVIRSQVGEQKLVAWFLPSTQKLDCFVWEGIVSEENKVVSEELEITNVEVSSVTDSTAQLFWETNLPASSTVRFGTDTELTESVAVPQNPKNHSVTLSGLVSGTKYFFQVSSKTADDKTASFFRRSFETTGTNPSEIEFKVLTLHATNVEIESAVVSFSTNLPATATVFYGTGNPLDLVAEQTEQATTHEVELSGLHPNSKYALEVEATDLLGRTARSFRSTFSTLQAVDISFFTKTRTNFLKQNDSDRKQLRAIDYAIQISNGPFQGTIPIHLEVTDHSGKVLCQADFEHETTTDTVQNAIFYFNATSGCFEIELASGTYSFSLTIDPNESITESAKHNNSFSGTHIVVV